ncbi:MAG TPA: response regulator [Microcoleaceae cyanobacterium]|jgi:DNA-binding response OmpR family regulator
MKILVIEDEDTIRETLEELLELEGFQVVAAENGLIGVQMAQAERPDLIISDVMMPELDGYGVLKQLQQQPETATIPFIFLTAKASLTDVRQGMNLGADDYLTKPFTLAELRQAIAIRLSKQASMMEQYWQERERTKSLQHQSQEHQNMAEAQEDILKKMVLELRNPLSNISMAIYMLERATTDQERDRYITILKEECTHEMALLNEVEQLQELLTSGHVKLLQRWQLFKSPSNF